MDDDSQRRLRWQCRRGLLELDLLLIRFLDERYSALDPGGREAFRELLNESDTVLLGWLQGREMYPDKFKEVITKII